MADRYQSKVFYTWYKKTKKELLKYVQYLLKKYFDIIATGPYLQKEAENTTVIKGVKYHYNQDLYAIAISRKNHI